MTVRYEMLYGEFLSIFSDSSYMIAAVFMKAVSLVTTAPFALLLAARFVNILFGLGTVWLVLDMGKRLFDRRKAWIAAAFVGLLPDSLFVFHLC